MKWTTQHLKQLQQQGKIRGYTDTTVKRDKKSEVVKIPPKQPAGITFIQNALTAAGISFVTEHRFHPERRFRFDFAIPDRKIAIEYEGLVSTGKKGGHQTKKHYTKDCDKYNLAQELGWKVYRYTTLNYKEFNVEKLK